MYRTYVWAVPIVFSAIAAYGCSSPVDAPQFAAATALGNCEFNVVGTSSPPSSGTPTVISQFTGTVISANFFNSGAIDLPYFDGEESVSICVSNPDSNGDRTAEITTDVGLDNDFNIKGYPQFLIGTKFGNIFETSYRFYQNTGLPDEDKWPVTSSSLSNQNVPFEFANLEYISGGKGVGLPAFTNDLPDISITLDIDEENVVGAERDIMLESWFYDTSANSEVIGNNIVTGLPIASTLNNIVGVGHPHYDELDNTLLEMMVHLGALSPNDVSGATNNPGQNQLTEVFSGKDHDLDGIDNHFDVDSHIFLNSTNPADPSPGKYSSGIDANADGIDDADLLPVQFGTQLYSIWYGQSFLAPIIIYSRETNSSLTSNFNPDLADMDLTVEGEIQLPWNEFLEFTLTDMQPLLQTAGVAWAMGSNNLFDRMSASGGAIGGVEFGVEPQTNNAADQPYVMTINKFDVNINGNSLGLLADNSAPISSISTPDTAEAILPQSSTIAGTATDVGGSGFDSIEVVIRDLTTGLWFDFNGGFSTEPIRQVTSLTNTTINKTDWNLALSLPPGRYRLQVVAFDGERNNNGWTRRNFVVAESDDLNPTGVITSPVFADATLSQNSILAGSVSDSGGSGIGSVEVIVLDRRTGQWFDFNGGFSSTAIRQTVSLSNLTTHSADWSQSVSLPPGLYRLQLVVFDGERNNSGWIRRDFVVGASDALNPIAAISVPAFAEATVPQTAILAGTASDTGGSGIGSVEIVILDRSTGHWFDFNGGFSSMVVRQTTNLTNLTTNATDWSQSVSLPPGRYRLQAVVFDGERNNSGWFRRDFVVGVLDSVDPGGTITVPVSTGATLPQSAMLAGTASDSGGSGIDSVEIVIRDLSTSQWFDFNGGFSSEVTRQVTDLSNLTENYSNWSQVITLLPGNYRLQVVVYDVDRNNSGWIKRDFVVE